MMSQPLGVSGGRRRNPRKRKDGGGSGSELESVERYEEPNTVIGERDQEDGGDDGGGVGDGGDPRTSILKL
jgi:hypothetical protein